MSDNREIAAKTAELFRLIAKKLDDHPDTINSLSINFVFASNSPQENSDIQRSQNEKQYPQVKENRKNADFDIFQVFSKDGKQALQERLNLLEISILKYEISRLGLDKTGNARKWTSKERLVDFIVTEVSNRMKRGEAFYKNESVSNNKESITEQNVNSEKSNRINTSGEEKAHEAISLDKPSNLE